MPMYQESRLKAHESIGSIGSIANVAFQKSTVVGQKSLRPTTGLRPHALVIANLFLWSTRAAFSLDLRVHQIQVMLP